MRDSGSETSGDFVGHRGDLFCCLAHLKHALQVRADELVEEVFFGLDELKELMFKVGFDRVCSISRYGHERFRSL
jgi:hypothetical protein